MIGRFLSPFDRAARMLRIRLPPRRIGRWSYQAALGRLKSDRAIARAEGRCPACGAKSEGFVHCAECRETRRIKDHEKYRPVGRGRLARPKT